LGHSPNPRLHPFRLGIALSGRLWIPFAFRLPAFASWILLHPLRVLLFSRTAYCTHIGKVGTDRIGVIMFCTLDMRLVRMPPVLREQGAGLICYTNTNFPICPGALNVSILVSLSTGNAA